MSTFSSGKKIKSMANSAVRLTQLLRTSPLKAFQLQILLYNADNRWLRNAYLPWYFTDCAVSSGWSSWLLNHIVHLVNVFIRAGTLRSVTALTSVHCAHVASFFSNPLMLLVVQPLFGILSLTVLHYIPSTDINSLLKSHVCRWKPCLQTMHWRYDVWDNAANKWLPK